jgi:hypothetical protein
VVRHLLMDPAFPDLVGKAAEEPIDDGARVWTVTRGPDGKIEERLDPARMADALIVAEGLREVAETRVW